MKRTVSAILGLITLAFVIAGASISRGHYSSYLFEALKSSLSSNGMELELENPRLARKRWFNLIPTTLTADRLTIGASRRSSSIGSLHPISITQVEANLSLLSCFILRPSLVLIGNQGDGTIVIRASSPLLRDGTRFSIQGKSLDVTQYQPIKGLGFVEGLLDVDLPDLVIANDTITEATGSVTLTKAHKPELTSVESLQQIIPEFAWAMSLPAWSPFTLTSQIHYKDKTISLTAINLSMDEGDLSGSTSFAPLQKTISLELKVSLTDKGQAKLGTFLPLLSAGKLQADTKSFQISANQASSPLGFKYTPATEGAPKNPPSN